MSDPGITQPAPPLPSGRKKLPRGLVILATSGAVCLGLIVALRVFNLARVFVVPTAGMSPEIISGDHVVMGGFSYLWGKPHRGDIVVFKTTGLQMTGPRLQIVPPDQLYIKRIAGEPGDHLLLADGKLFINGDLVTLSNAAGPIAYPTPPGMPAITNFTVPTNSYFVIGDNAINSLDSRYFGAVPRANIIGRVGPRYWPPARAGMVK